jgi:cell division protein FtsZ
MGTAVASGEQRARQAAEAAIASPLLEDINLSGAKGILVNITAGLDMSIGEFEEVGDVIKEFISDEATVVLGTVIDPEMNDQVRVTVIVTGLGEPQTKYTPNHHLNQSARPMMNSNQASSINKIRMPESRRQENELGFEHFDKPAVIRKQNQNPNLRMPSFHNEASASKPQNEANASMPDMDYLDIPAFLRRHEEV